MTDINLVGQHREADRTHVGNLALDEVQDDIDVMDHEIQHHIDVGAARFEGGEPVRLDEQRFVQHFLERKHGRVEALDVPHLE
ncbi:hypothetical protein D3C83_15410 [compost metagenome]